MNKMRANRAAQFSPFDSLKGLQEALREKEEHHSRIERQEFCEERQNEISSLLNRLERGIKIKITYYTTGHYKLISGKVTDINVPYRYILIDNVKVYFDDVSEIEFE